MVLNIMYPSVLLVDKTGVPWENNQISKSQWQTLSYKVVLSVSPQREEGAIMVVIVL
jgi:hypothetical protein